MPHPKRRNFWWIDKCMRFVCALAIWRSINFCLPSSNRRQFRKVSASSRGLGEELQSIFLSRSSWSFLLGVQAKPHQHILSIFLQLFSMCAFHTRLLALAHSLSSSDLNPIHMICQVSLNYASVFLIFLINGTSSTSRTPTRTRSIDCGDLPTANLFTG